MPSRSVAKIDSAAKELLQSQITPESHDRREKESTKIQSIAPFPDGSVPFPGVTAGFRTSLPSA